MTEAFFRRAGLIVILRLTGGLGNQMFQYAAAGPLAGRPGAELLLDPHDFEHALAFQAYAPTANCIDNMRRIYLLGVRFLDNV